MCAYVLNRKIAGEPVPPGQRVTSQLVQAGPLGGAQKRVLDVVVSAIALVLLSPLMLLVAGLARIVFGGPAIVRQERLGFEGKTYECYRFRLAAGDGQFLDVPEKSASCLRNVLSRSGLDELPQLLNVLRGDMSLVGPCPIRPDQIAQYGNDAHAYLQARPGLTGMWTTDGRDSTACASRRIAGDKRYLAHWSLALDLQLLMKPTRAR